MALFLFIPLILWIAYALMIICAWQAYVRSSRSMAAFARIGAVISCLGLIWDIFAGQIFLLPFKTGAVWACWQLSARQKHSFRDV
ncbi:MAG: hypothetical protein JNL02_03215 [Saprospiraceae bacterium]|nr:hypothetical protein [Saprospiraceae bacterium]